MRTIMTILASISLLFACNNSAKKETRNYRMFAGARAAQDYQTAITALSMMATEDSAQYPWAIDSLAFYHFFYMNIPGLVKNPSTSLHYCDKGLASNPENAFLTELKGKLLLSQGKDSMAMALFTALWNKNKDYTYLWEITFLNMATGKFNICDSTIKMVLSQPDAATKKVRFTHPEVPLQESIDARAAFLFFDALMKNNQGNFIGAAETLSKCLEYSPNFYLAKKGIYEMQQNATGKGSAQ
jgi:tetratricopeptide (TPR) repeat protein